MRGSGASRRRRCRGRSAASPTPPPPRRRRKTRRACASSAHGLRVGPPWRGSVVGRIPNSGRFVIPTTTKPGLAQPPHQVGGVIGPLAGEEARAAVELPALDRRVALDRDRHARERRGVAGLDGVGLGQRPLAVDLDERVERRVERLDAPQRGLDDLTRGRVAGAHERGGLFGGHEREVVHVAPAPYLPSARGLASHAFRRAPPAAAGRRTPHPYDQYASGVRRGQRRPGFGRRYAGRAAARTSLLDPNASARQSPGRARPVARGRARARDRHQRRADPRRTAPASAAPTCTSTTGTPGRRRRSRCRWSSATSSSARSSRSARTSPTSTPGEIVSGEGHVVCGRCRNCLAGRRHLCARHQGHRRQPPGRLRRVPRAADDQRLASPRRRSTATWRRSSTRSATPCTPRCRSPCSARTC